MTDAPAQTPIPPQRVMSQFLFAKQLTASLAALARLGVADHMGETPISAEELAAKVGAHAPSLFRVMRMLAGFGVFSQEPGGKFALTPLGALLRTDAPGSMRYMAMMLGDEWSMHAYTRMTDCIRTGQDGISMAYGKPIFDLFAERPEQAETFQRAMSGGSAVAAQSILATYDFSGIERLADLGGGHGLLLASVLQRYPGMRGVLFDLPEVVAGVPDDRLASCGGRLRVEAGSFFERVPQGCDAYMMKHIIHDWSDEHCRNILRLIRRQLPPHGRVLVCEQVMPEEPGPAPAKMLDIEMLVMTVGGKERTPREFSELFASAGLKLGRIVTTPTPISVVEAHPS
jgi:O-methyltransferase domain